ncbi:hypothetical protein RQP46_003101 [Phenoliferia psychrophenolica]
MTTIDSLPNETLSKILDLLKGDRPTWSGPPRLPAAGQNDSLRAAALVCQRAQRIVTSPTRHRFRTGSITTEGERPDAWLAVAESVVWDVLARPCFTDLEHLSFKGPLIFKAPSNANVSLSMHLRSLAMILGATYAAPQSFADSTRGLITALCSSSRHSLQNLTLQLRHSSAEELVRDALPFFSEGLTTLVLEAWGYNAFESQTHQSTLFWSLKTLKFHWFPSQVFRGFDHRYLAAVLDALPSPPTLRRLSLSTGPIPPTFSQIDRYQQLVPLVHLLDHPALSLLDALELPHLPSPHSEAQEPVGILVTIAQACEAHGIKLRWS